MFFVFFFKIAVVVFTCLIVKGEKTHLVTVTLSCVSLRMIPWISSLLSLHPQWPGLKDRMKLSKFFLSYPIECYTVWRDERHTVGRNSETVIQRHSLSPEIRVYEEGEWQWRCFCCHSSVPCTGPPCSSTDDFPMGHFSSFIKLDSVFFIWIWALRGKGLGFFFGLFSFVL